MLSLRSIHAAAASRSAKTPPRPGADRQASNRSSIHPAVFPQAFPGSGRKLFRANRAARLQPAAILDGRCFRLLCHRSVRARNERRELLQRRERVSTALLHRGRSAFHPTVPVMRYSPFPCLHPTKFCSADEALAGIQHVFHVDLARLRDHQIHEPPPVRGRTERDVVILRR